jgi:hypothetical protein
VLHRHARRGPHRLRTSVPNVFQQTDPDRYQALARIPSAVGAGTSGYFGRGRKGFDLFYVAVPARGSNPAEILVYTVQDE